MRICFAMLHYDPRDAVPDPETYLARVPIHRALPRAVARRGHDVHVVHLFPTRHVCSIDGVTHHFIPAPWPSRTLSWLLSRTRPRDRAIYELAFSAVECLRQLKPDVVHFHGLTLTWNLLLTATLLDRRVPLVLHYHGGYPPRNPFARAALARGLRRASSLLFTAREQSGPFVAAGLLPDDLRVSVFVEMSSEFCPEPRAIARQATGMGGDPGFVWAGRLHPIKDPVTALLGFEQIGAAWPDAQLYLYFRSSELLAKLQELVRERPALRNRVHFRGEVAPQQMADVYNSADFFLQASQREISGCAVLEAMACGTIPIVTDIPSFRAMTDGGRYGVLFPPSDPDEMAKRTLAVPRDEIAVRSRAIRDHFERALSYPALAKRLEAIYEDALSRHDTRRP